MAQKLKIGLVGLGKIAVDQHIPSINANKHLELVAGCSPNARPDGVKAFTDMDSMLAAHPEIDAISICTPPQVRFDIARQAIAGGRHVFLEKPPAATLGEAEAIKALAQAAGVTLLASWHSRFAPAVEAARDWIASNPLKSVNIQWKENVRQWHPGQKWIFEAGGMGVFDPGINSLSILTRIVQDAIIVRKSDLHIPSNCQAPIQVEMDLTTSEGVPVRAEYDFLQTGVQTWSIYAEAQSGSKMALHMGGTEMEVDGRTVIKQKEAEYPGLYNHFFHLVNENESDADFSPLRIVADAMLIGSRINAPEYVE